MSLENHLNNISKLPESIKTLDELFEKIKNPEELLEFMGDNIKYGYVGKNNRKIYPANDPDSNKDFAKEYFLQSPEELLISKYGVCWDQTELERSWLAKHEYDFISYFLMFAGENSLPTHTFLAYQQDNKFYWFENSFEAQRGIHEYDNFDELAEDVKKKFFESAKHSGAKDDDFKDIMFLNYETPKFDCDCNEFVDGIINPVK